MPETLSGRVLSSPVARNVRGVGFRSFTMRVDNRVVIVMMKTNSKFNISKIVIKNRNIKVIGEWQFWVWENLGNLFGATEVEGVVYEMAAPNGKDLNLKI